MSDQNDKALHDWVRQTLHNYQPDGAALDWDALDWAALQRKRERRRWWRLGAVSLLVVLIGGMAYFFVSGTEGSRTAVRQTQTARKKPSENLSGKVSYRPPVTSLPAPANRQQDSFRAEKSSPSISASQPTGAQHLPVTTVSRRVTLGQDLLPLRSIELLIHGATGALAKTPLPVPLFSPEELAIKEQILTGRSGLDPTSSRVLARNLRHWPDAVVVCDLTTSMYPYTTQLFTWLRKNARSSAPKGFVFFTDCDSLGRETRSGGPAGQLFITQKLNGNEVLPLLLLAARNTINNRDEAENNIEALLAAQQRFPDARHLILLADNGSTVKDMHRLSELGKPVHVVLCGTTFDSAQAFQPDYRLIASRTNGSLHTLEDDLDPNAIAPHTWLRVGNRYYRYQARKDRFKVTRYQHRPGRFLRFIWL